MAAPVNPSAAPEDHRREPRVAVDAFVKIAGQEREFVFRTRDLSKGGLFLYTKVGHVYPFKVGSTLALELYDYDRFVNCKVVVVRVVQQDSPEAGRYPTGFGVRIVEIDETSRQHLDEMLARIERDGAAY
jgi:c-di-GMP-binding flagellar brake protein YcgR